MLNSLKNKQGFSLIELLVYMVIFTIFLVMTLQMFSTILNTQLESERTSAISHDGQFILNRFAYDIGRAQSIVTPKGVLSTTLELVVDNQPLKYYLNGETLILDVGSSLNRLNSYKTTLASISFLRLEGGEDKDVVQLSFTLNSEDKIKSFQTTVGLR